MQHTAAEIVVDSSGSSSMDTQKGENPIWASLPKPRLGLIGRSGSLGDREDSSKSFHSQQNEKQEQMGSGVESPPPSDQQFLGKRQREVDELDTERDSNGSMTDMIPHSEQSKVLCSHLLGLFNRSAQCVRLGRWEEALVEAMWPAVHKSEGGHEWKFAIGMYLLEMHSYTDCRSMINKVKEMMDNPPPKQPIFGGSSARGSLDRFVGPLRCCQIPGKGRGLVATRNIAEGELLLISDPIAESDAAPSTFNPCDMLYGALINAVVNQVSRCPADMARLYALDSGASHQSVPSVDLFVSETVAVEAASAFPRNVTSISQISAIVERNAISSRRDGSCATQRMCALYLLPSLFNHSCCPNAAQIFVGSTLVVTAAAPIAAGEEVTLQYFDVLTTVDERERMCARFKCTCDRCRFENNLGGLVESFILHSMACIMPVWTGLTDPTVKNIPAAARSVANRAIAIRTMVSVEKFIQSLAVTPQQSMWLRASTFRVTETLLRCYLTVDAVDRIVLNLLDKAVRVVEQVCPAGVDHALWLQQAWMATSKLSGKDCLQAQLYRKSLNQVKRMRYSPIPEWVLHPQ